MQTKIGNVWVETDGNEITHIYGTGLAPEQVDVVVEDVGTVTPEELLDPFSLVLGE